MQTIKYVRWEEDGAWIRYLRDYADYWTQGEMLEDLDEAVGRAMLHAIRLVGDWRDATPGTPHGTPTGFPPPGADAPSGTADLDNSDTGGHLPHDRRGPDRRLGALRGGCRGARSRGGVGHTGPRIGPIGPR